MHRCQGCHAIHIFDACTAIRDAMLYMVLMHGLQALMVCQPSSHTVESGSVYRHEFDWQRACGADGHARLAVLSTSAAQVQAAMITPGLHFGCCISVAVSAHLLFLPACNMQNAHRMHMQSMVRWSEVQWQRHVVANINGTESTGMGCAMRMW